MKRLLHLVLILTVSFTIAFGQSIDGGVSKVQDESLLAKNKIENILFASDEFIVSNPYPNPADDFVKVDYSMPLHSAKAELVIRNILGNKVGSYTLNPENRAIKISISHLDAGIYFHTLYLDNKNLVTRKLIIKRS